MGIPGEPNNPKREKLTIDIDNTARSKNKLVQLDIMRNLSIQNLMIENGRKFVNEGN